MKQSESEKTSIAVNYFYNMGYRLLSILAPIITMPYISRVLGVDNVGIVNYTYSIVSYFVLFGVMGLDMYGQREIAYVAKNQKKKSQLFWKIEAIRFITCGSSAFLYFLSCFYMEYKEVAFIWEFQIISHMLDISWYFYGLERFKKITIRNIIIKLLEIALIFLLVKDKNDLNMYIGIRVISLLAGNLLLWNIVCREVDRPYKIKLEFKKCFKPILIMFLPQAMDSVYMVMDKVMLGYLSNMTEVGLYSQADKIIKMLVTIVTAMGLVVMPKIAQCHAEHKQEEIKEILLKGFRFVFILALPMGFGVSAIAMDFVSWFFGRGYDGVAILMCLLSPVIFLMGLNSVMGWQYLMSVKRERDFLKSISAGAVLNFLLNAVLIPHLLAKGAAFASVIAMSLMSGINFWLVRTQLEGMGLLKHFLKPILSSVVMFAVIVVLNYHLNHGMLEMFFKVIVGLLIYLIMEMLLKDEFFIRWIKKYIKFL